MGKPGEHDALEDGTNPPPLGVGQKIVNELFSIMSGLYSYSGGLLVSGVSSVLSVFQDQPTQNTSNVVTTVSIPGDVNELEEAELEHVRTDDPVIETMTEKQEDREEVSTHEPLAELEHVGKDDSVTEATKEKEVDQEQVRTEESVTETTKGTTDEPSEQQKGEEVAKALQDLSSKALQTLSELTPPTGYAKLTGKLLVERLKTAAAFKPMDEFTLVIGQLINRKTAPQLLEIQKLIANADTLKKALADARNEVLIELQERKEQIDNQRGMVTEQITKNGELLDKLRQPSSLVGTLLKSWPREVKREDLSEQFAALVDTGDIEIKQAAVKNLHDQEWGKQPWTDADWLGNVMPAAQGLYADLRKALADMNVDAQKVVVDALNRALVKKREAETTSKNSVIEAINGGQNRTELASKLEKPGSDIYKEIEEGLAKGKLSLHAQLELVNQKYAARENVLKEQQKTLVEAAKNAGVVTTEPDPSKYSGLQYKLLGTHGKATVYARLDDCPQSDGMGEFLALYTTALSKGIIPSSSTGSEGVKYEGHLNGWVVKVTLRAVSHNPGFDNTWSPLARDGTSAKQQVEPPAIYLNFDEWTQRH